jgi:hypothetical protein
LLKHTDNSFNPSQQHHYHTKALLPQHALTLSLISIFTNVQTSPSNQQDKS